MENLTNYTNYSAVDSSVNQLEQMVNDIKNSMDKLQSVVKEITTSDIHATWASKLSEYWDDEMATTVKNGTNIMLQQIENARSTNKVVQEFSDSK